MIEENKYFQGKVDVLQSIPLEPDGKDWIHCISVVLPLEGEMVLKEEVANVLKSVCSWYGLNVKMQEKYILIIEDVTCNSTANLKRIEWVMQKIYELFFQETMFTHDMSERRKKRIIADRNKRRFW